MHSLQYTVGCMILLNNITLFPLNMLPKVCVFHRKLLSGIFITRHTYTKYLRTALLDTLRMYMRIDSELLFVRKIFHFGKLLKGSWLTNIYQICHINFYKLHGIYIHNIKYLRGLVKLVYFIFTCFKYLCYAVPSSETVKISWVHVAQSRYVYIQNTCSIILFYTFAKKPS